MKIAGVIVNRRQDERIKSFDDGQLQFVIGHCLSAEHFAASSPV